MYTCYAQVQFPDSQKWFARTLQALQSLNPAWHFQINSPGEDHYVDAGPLDCEITPTEGPYVGQCPLHLQLAKQGDGTAKVYLWMNSLSSPYLLKHAAAPASKTVPPRVEGCDDFYQETEMDDFTGADMTAWYAVEPGGKHDVRVYVSAESVGLHITVWHSQ